jgi:FkbM family methyltransferase
MIGERIYSNFFNGVYNGVFVECGAIDGVKNSICKTLQDNYGWVGYNFEPNPYSFNKLVENRKKDTNINVALSNTNGEISFYIPKSKNGRINGGGTLVEGRRNDIIETVNVKTITYGDFINEYSPEKIDLMVLDVEGHEISVINGMVGVDTLPNFIMVEVNKINVTELERLLNKIGYTKTNFKIDNNNNLYSLK